MQLILGSTRALACCDRAVAGHFKASARTKRLGYACAPSSGGCPQKYSDFEGRFSKVTFAIAPEWRPAQSHVFVKHLKSKSSDLRRLFQRSITVREITEPLVSFDADRDSASILSFLEARNFDVA